MTYIHRLEMNAHYEWWYSIGYSEGNLLVQRLEATENGSRNVDVLICRSYDWE